MNRKLEELSPNTFPPTGPEFDGSFLWRENVWYEGDDEVTETAA